MEEIFNTIRRKRKKNIKFFGIPVLAMILLIIIVGYGDLEDLFSMLGLLGIPLLIFSILLITEIIIYIDPKKETIFKDLTFIGSTDDIIKYIEVQKSIKIMEDDEIILTPELIINKKDITNIILLNDVADYRLVSTSGKNYQITSFYFHYYNGNSRALKLGEISPSDYQRKVDTKKIEIDKVLSQIKKPEI